MQIEYKHSRLERVIYTFDEIDIKRALIAMQGIKEYQPGKRVEFEMDEDSATITIIYEQPQEAQHDE